MRERRREPVRETEVGVRLRQRSRDPAEPGGEHHRPRDVAAAAEHDVGTAPREDAQARDRRGDGERERPKRRRLGRRGKPATRKASNA